MQNIITGKVAAVIDDTTLVLNVGYRDGVHEGLVFVIFAEYQEIEDPDSGEALGKWEVVKARVVVDHVQERMCTVRSPLADEQERPGTLSAMMVQHSFGQYGRRTVERERLEVRTGDTSGRPQNQPVTVGDQAHSLPLEEEKATESGAAEKQSEQPQEAAPAASGAAEKQSEQPQEAAPAAESDEEKSGDAEAKN